MEASITFFKLIFAQKILDANSIKKECVHHDTTSYAYQVCCNYFISC